MRLLLIFGSTRRGSVNTAAPGRGGDATATLALVLGYAGATVIERACRDLHVPRSAVGPDGLVTDPEFAAAGDALWAALTAGTTS